MHKTLVLALLTVVSGMQVVRAEDRPIIDAFSGKNQEIEFEAVVVERLRSDGFWSGFMVSYQGVRYQVTKMISGDPGALDVTVYHPLISRSYCEIDGDQVVLSKDIFAVGNRLRLKVDKTPKGILVGFGHAYSVPQFDGEKNTAEPGATDNPGDAK